MNFLEQFTAEQRSLFEQEGARCPIPEGDYLMRRGEPGGDIFYVESGEFDIVDTRNEPETILRICQPGELIGEMSFIDESPRSADVRARSDGVVLRWNRADVRSLLIRNPVLSAVFFESMARTATSRTREITSSALRGSLGAQESRGTTDVALAEVEARALVERTKALFLESETRLRQDPLDRGHQARVREVLDELTDAVSRLSADHPHTEAQAAAGRAIRRELHPYLVRSSLAERCYRRTEGVGGAADVLAHVLFDAAGGDGQLGEIIDRWWLDRPSFKAMRAFRKSAVPLLIEHLPRNRNRRVLVINAGTGSMIAALAAEVAHPPTVITVVDSSREALAYLDETVSSWPSSVELVTRQESLAGFALRRTRLDVPPQDAILIHGLLEYLPERVAISLLDVSRELLAPGGVLVSSSLGESADGVCLNWLLGWPIIRRSTDTLTRMYQAAGFDGVSSGSQQLDTPHQGSHLRTGSPVPAQIIIGRAAAQPRRSPTPLILLRR